jgi:hypothetical protein
MELTSGRLEHTLKHSERESAKRSAQMQPKGADLLQHPPSVSTGRESCAVEKAFATFGYDLCAPRWLFGDFGVQAFQLELEIAYAFEIPVSLLPLLFVHIRRPGSASLYLFRIKRRREDAIVIYQLPIVAERLPRGGDSACCPRFSDLAAGGSS